MTKRYRQQRVKDLPKVPTWRPEWDSNLRPSGRKAPTCHLATPPHILVFYFAPISAAWVYFSRPFFPKCLYILLSNTSSDIFPSFIHKRANLFEYDRLIGNSRTITIP